MSERPSDLSRRAFLAATGGVIAGAALLSWEDLASAHFLSHNDPAPSGSSHGYSALVLSSDLYPSPAPQRFVFAIAKGKNRSSFGRARVGFLPPGSAADANGTGTVTVRDAQLFKAGLPRGRGVYVIDAVFDQPGDWTAVLDTHGVQLPFAIEVKPAPEAPTVGSAASRAPSPTTTDKLGVHPICTRQPACPLHTISTSDVIGTGKLVAVMFATPARCQSQYCGPVLDALLDVRKPYEDRVTFIHVDIYENNKTTKLAPTVEAWRLPSEPWLYTVDGSGTIVGRIDGAFGRDEIVTQLDALVGTAG